MRITKGGSDAIMFPSCVLRADLLSRRPIGAGAAATHSAAVATHNHIHPHTSAASTTGTDANSAGNTPTCARPVSGTNRATVGRKFA
jgi:hypothetical protein